MQATLSTDQDRHVLVLSLKHKKDWKSNNNKNITFYILMSFQILNTGFILYASIICLSINAFTAG
jgi:hypothetical protein